jgi:hypothetical protein
MRNQITCNDRCNTGRNDPGCSPECAERRRAERAQSRRREAAATGPRHAARRAGQRIGSAGEARPISAELEAATAGSDHRLGATEGP